MNTRENLLDLLTEGLEREGYNVCMSEELPWVVGRCGFPIAVVSEPKLVAGGAPEATVISYDVVVKLLIQRCKSVDKSAPMFAIIEHDALAVAEAVAQSDGVVGLTVRELAPIAGGVTHAGDVAMEVALRVEMFRNV